MKGPNGQSVENGIYQSRAHGTKFHPYRNVYIQDGFVSLVDDDCHYVFHYNFFFDVNKIGARISDLPKGLSIWSLPPSGLDVLTGMECEA